MSMECPYKQMETSMQDSRQKKQQQKKHLWRGSRDPSTVMQA